MSQTHSHNHFRMPPKRKDNSATSAASGPKTKRSKPSFRTPGSKATEESEVNSTKNRVVTLRSTSSGRRGYRTQDLAMTSNSNPASPATDISHLPPHISDGCENCDSISHPTEESNMHSVSNTKSRPKQKNTTTVRLQLIKAGISLTWIYVIDKTY